MQLDDLQVSLDANRIPSLVCIQGESVAVPGHSWWRVSSGEATQDRVSTLGRVHIDLLWSTLLQNGRMLSWVMRHFRTRRFWTMLRPRIHANESTASLAALLLAAAVTVCVTITRASRAVSQSWTLSRLLLFTADSDEIGTRLLILVNVNGADGSFGTLFLLARVTTRAHTAALFIVGCVNVVLAGDSLAVPVVLLTIWLSLTWRLSGMLHLLS